jgi:hypothetical protein
MIILIIIKEKGLEKIFYFRVFLLTFGNGDLGVAVV